MNDETLADGLYLCERLAPTHPGIAALLDRYWRQKSALEDVGGGDGEDTCPWCGGFSRHDIDCQRQLALGIVP